MQFTTLRIVSSELTKGIGVHFKEFMQVTELRGISSFCTSTRINCYKKQQLEFCYKTRENKRALHEVSKLYEGQYFTGTVLVDLGSRYTAYTYSCTCIY